MSMFPYCYISMLGSEEGGHVHVSCCIVLKIFHVSPCIGYNTKIGTDGVEWGRLNIWMVGTPLQVGVSFIVIALLFWLKK